MRPAPGGARWSRAGRFLFAEPASPVWLAWALLALEVIPVYAWLLIVGAFGGGGADRVAVPLWLLALAALGYWWIGARAMRWWYGLEIVLAVLLGAGASLLAIALSAFTTAPASLLDFSWLTGLGDDLIANAPSASGAILIIAVFAYLGWRSVSIGRRLPDVSGAKRRFAYSFGALLLATLTVVGLPVGPRLLVVGWLSLLLPLDVFAGLLAASLARRQEAQLARAESSQIDGLRWMGVALVLSGLVVLIALALGVLINLDAVTALLGHLGPVGQALGDLINGALLLVERILSALLTAPLEWLRQAFQTNGATTIQQPPILTNPAQGPKSADLGRFRFLAVAFMSVAVSLALIVLALAFLRFLRREEAPQPEDAVDEERSALDGNALLREQARDFLERFRRSPRVAIESLPIGSIRRLYRDLLAAASQRGVVRRKAETPDEFASRLADSLGGDGAEVTTLTDAYDTARYGEREPERAQLDALHSVTQRLTRKLSPR
jgi:hypothetical protein